MNVAAVIDSREHAQAQGDYRLYAGGVVTGTKGRTGLTSIDITHSGGTRTLLTDCVAMSGGWNPTVHLTCHMNGRPQWRDDILSFVPTPGSIPGMVVAGADT